eukprot:TRINITY_DN34786_c0_g1_i1.p1 TRINITY_DN34786_c0_g1~~TRINITY_DN34786_c0_g1_i1.p1  ORF type:complete len:468 (+),score=83.15 TRINITY_DN34786_c0_g1_i1:49-1452(+)
MAGYKEDVQDASGPRAVQLLKEPDLDVLAQLRVLNVARAGLTELPGEALGHCKQLVRLDVSDNALSTLPSSIASLPCLDILFASKLGMTEIPSHLALSPCLRMLGVKDNKLTCIDGNSLPTSLEWLIAAGNQIQELPNIARLQRIRKLMLSHNQLTCDSLAPVADISALEMLRVAANRLEAFPEALLRHSRLAWVAVGSNPFAERAIEKQLAEGPKTVDFSEVTLGDQLGSGAGATVHQGKWHDQNVAVKIWDSECFSDGTAAGEWAINRVASSPGHASLVGVLGAFDEPKRGLILELLQGATAAAGPPTFSTVTRDALPCHGGPGPRYTIAAVQQIALAVASAAAYLHEKGLMHGDIYLHNTLVILDGAKDAANVKDARLSDFGAAAAIENPLLRKLEVRSYGWLLQDLLETRTDPASELETSTLTLLQEIRAQCGQAVPENLPIFAEIVSKLEDSKRRKVPPLAS